MSRLVERRAAWVDPAPLEVARPRLPWWMNMPRRALGWLAPLILAVFSVRLLAGLARRAYRYPIAFAVLAAAGAWWLWRWDGWTVAFVASLLGSAGLLWWWHWPTSFDRWVWAQVRAEYRRMGVYAFRWHRVMVFSDLAKRVKDKTYVPRLVRVRSDAWRDRVTVRLLAGQEPAHFEHKAEALAHSFGAASCRVRVVKPRRVVLDLVHGDPLARPIDPPTLPAMNTGVDLRRLVIGRTEYGTPAVLRLLGNQVLVVGSMGAGKASVLWAVLRALAPAIRTGMVQVFGIDPKGGMELGRAPALFTRLVCDNGPDAVELLEHVATLTRQRAAGMRTARRRKWSPVQGAPFVLLVVDELADLIAYQPDRKLRDRANAAVQTIVSQGRAPGVAVLGLLQDPRKTVVDFRHLFTTRLALRLDEPAQVDMVLGDGVRQRGATADEIPESTPGVVWMKQDGRREPTRFRAYRITDADLDVLTAYVTGASSDEDDEGSVVRQLPAGRAA
ncbi:MAG TPA: FtsK/SpoIIIE domain-containing protein [Pseudonocardiaceae bacterium]